MSANANLALILADNVESGQFRAAILKQRSIDAVVVRYSANGNGIKIPMRYDIVVIDSHYNTESTLTLLRHTRGQTSVPFILLTYETDVRHHLNIYELGVDECVTKPVSELLFLAKVSAWLRQKPCVPHGDESYKEKNDTISYNGMTLDPQRRLVSTQDGGSIRLSDLEFRLLHVFMVNRGRVLETNQLLRNVWNYEDVSSRLLTNLVYRLRQKLAVPPTQANHIKTIERIGYMFE